MNRVAGVVLVALLATIVGAVAIGGVASAQDGATGNESIGQEYSITELEENGVHPGGPDSQRWLSEYGSATVRYTPVGPFSSEWEYLERDTTVNADEITLRTVRLAPADQLDRELTVTVVAWERGQRETVVDNRTVDRPAALNQTVHRQEITLGRGYDEATIDLPSNFDRTAEVTMWVDEYPDARWRFQHRSLPSAQKVDISSAGDAQTYAFNNATLPGILAIVAGLFGGKATRNRTGRGPGWGLIVWAIVGTILTFALASAAFFEIAVVLRYFPWMLGFILFVIAYGGYLAVSGDAKTIQFERPELFEAQVGPDDEEIVTTALEDDRDDGDPEIMPDGGAVLNGDGTDSAAEEAPAETNGHRPGTGLPEIKEWRYTDIAQIPAIETPDGRIRVPKKGIRPFLARLFADGAELDKSQLMTKIEVREGKADEKIIVDPESDQVIEHEPAHLERRWPVLHAVDDDADQWSRATGLVLMLLVCVGMPTAGWMVGGNYGAPMLGAALGALPALVDAYTAKDGRIDFEPANEHFRRARATLVDLQREQADGKTLESYKEMAWTERSRTAEEAMEVAEHRDRTLSENLLSGATGLDMSDDNATGVEDTAPDETERESTDE